MPKTKTRKILKLENSFPLGTIYIVVFVLTVWIDGYVFPEKNLLALYLFNIIIAGTIFWRSLAFQIIMTGLLTWLYYYFAPFPAPNMEIIIIRGLTHFLAILSISMIIKYYKRENESTLNLALALAKSLDARDKYTALHSEHVANYACMIAKEMGLSRKKCEQIHLGGLLHDIGKIGISESILLKPSRLTLEEYELIKQHPAIGYQMVKHITFFQKNGILDAILYHHEHFDGTGYPQGLKGKQIPLIARILAVADSFDAMTSSRVYRDKSDKNHAIDQLKKNAGTQFDPAIVDVFINIIADRSGGRKHPCHSLHRSPGGQWHRLR
ncbi:HD-GYP domain-containing protein [Brevibacillus choshinensis]|uniref:HD-GYP domain-containing protein n=1 Tax=Brevibacillus choshinensis TaxID=54911 RepID=A0ABX7FJN0_BRECH|nr:HD-GYP domain-containing protein [Brevibacillus choshinensis]QRG66424.1 HD-GYP domain-containing protein [Brevibacillus choshinensis]